MAWLTTHNDTNKIITAEREIVQTVDFFTVAYTRTISEEQYEYVGMTKTAADTCLSAMAVLGYSATLQSENKGGAYKVIVTEVTYSAWSVV